MYCHKCVVQLHDVVRERSCGAESLYIHTCNLSCVAVIESMATYVQFCRQAATCTITMLMQLNDNTILIYKFKCDVLGTMTELPGRLHARTRSDTGDVYMKKHTRKHIPLCHQFWLF